MPMEPSPGGSRWNSRPNLSRQSCSPADRLIGPAGQIRAGHSTPAVGIPNAMQLNPRTTPSPSSSPAPPLRPTQSNSPVPQTGNTLAGTGSRDDLPARQILPAPAAVHASRVAILSALSPPHFSTGGRCARTARLADWLAPTRSAPWHLQHDREKRRQRSAKRIAGRMAKNSNVMATAPTGRFESIRVVRRGSRPRTSKGLQFESGLRPQAPEISACSRCGTERTAAAPQAS